MRAFAGAEPLVGEVVGLRTFRVDESGLLLPLYSGGAWYDGGNTATCDPPTGGGPAEVHAVPDEGCECGFYAYGSERAALANRHSRYVLAVVSCWGSVVAGTQGVRAEHARIDAIWLHPNVANWTRRRVASRYPSARMYTDRGAMLAEHPPSVLPCYAEVRHRHRLTRVSAVLVGAAVLGLGAVPVATLHAAAGLWVAWLVATVAVATLALVLVLGRHVRGHLAAAWIAAGILAWLLAPQFGLAGWVLRVPVLRGLLVAAGGFLLSLWPGYFPIEKGPRERGFCGVHP